MAYTYYTGAGQADFTAETPTSDYVLDYPLGPQEPSALLISQKFMQVRANYGRPVANASMVFAAARTNLLLQSNAFSTSPWGITGTITFQSAATTTPSGFSAWKIADNDASFDTVNQSITVANDGTSYTFSALVKRNNGVTGQLTIGFSGGTPIDCSCSFDWTTGVATRLGSTAGSVLSTPWGNGWYRVSVTLPNNSSGNTTLTVNLYPESSSAGGQSSNYFYGAQVEAATAATAYIETTTAAVTVPAVTAYFVNDSGFADIRAGVMTWTRTWATIPANHYDPIVYPYQFPAILSTVVPTGLTYVTVSNVSENGGDKMYIDYLAPVGGRVALSYRTNVGAVLNSVVVYDNGLSGSIVGRDSSFIQTTYTKAAVYAPSVTSGVRRYPLNAPGRAVVSYGYFLASAGAATFAITPQAKQRFLLGSEEVPFVSNSTTPTAASYYALVTGFSWFVAEDEQVERYQGNIMQRKVTYVYAQ